MNDKSYPKIHISTLAVLIAGVCVALPVACSDDDQIPPISEAGAGGESSSGGSKASGGSSTGGKIGSGGAGGGASTGGASSGGAGSGGESSGGASSGGASSGGASSGGAVNTGGAEPDGGDDDGGVGCSGPLDPDTANLCITFSPEAVNAVSGDVALNNVGTLVVQVFNTEYPVAGNQAHLAAPTKFYPAPPTATPGSSEQVAVTALPKIGFDNLPTTVYVRAFFIDNPAWFATQTGLRYGMQVGGLNFNLGVRPPTTPPVPAVRAVTLTNGQETALDLRMFAMKKFTASVMKFPGTASPPAGPVVPSDDAQGPLSVGVFAARGIASSPLFGGIEGICANVNTTPATVSGFFVNNVTVPTGGTQMWFGAQLNDYNLTQTGATPPPGSLISIVLEGDPPVQLAPSTQHAQVMPGAYSVTLDPIPTGPSTTAPSPIFLTTVAPGLPTPLPPSYQCPPPSGTGGTSSGSGGASSGGASSGSGGAG